MKVIVHTSPYSFKVKLNQNGMIKDTLVPIGPFLGQLIDKSWDHMSRRYVTTQKYFYYNKRDEYLYIPKFLYTKFYEYVKTYGGVIHEIQRVIQKGKSIDLSMKPGYQDKSEKQTEAINTIINIFKDNAIRGLSLQTGGGKTVSFIRICTLLKKRAILCTNGLVDQWIEEVLLWTGCDKEDIYVIKGYASIVKLLKEIDKTIFPKIIIASTPTLQEYATDNSEAYKELPPFEDFFDICKIGVRGIDEAHERFKANLIIDMMSNTEILIPISATLGRSKEFEKKIFNLHYPQKQRYGEGDFDRYINVYSYSYDIGYLPSRAYQSPKGYSGAKYEAYLLKNKLKIESVYDTVLKPIIRIHYLNKRDDGHKLLMLCTTINMCEYLVTKLRRDTNCVVNLYISGTPNEVLKESDIIVSTPGSAGTGTDIKNLLATIQTVSTKAEIINVQTLGRTRKLPDRDPEYITVHNRGIRSHVEHNKTREILYRERGKSYESIKL
jgi:superfamily II DNA or RNA helicase